MYVVVREGRAFVSFTAGAVYKSDKFIKPIGGREGVERTPSALRDGAVFSPDLI